MTLERLQFKQFGPYAAPQTINFSDFAEHRLFLIHGATGSGKSFVLDAICYALYSESSGSERGSRDLRSHYATPDDPTEVTLDFRLGEKRYRVQRRPRMELTARRGTGTVERGPDAWLYDRTDVKGDDEGILLEDGKTAVTDRIKELLGLQVDQFRQVVLLPQGKFRDFLSADSGDRENILKVLFDTQQFADLEDELNTMHSEAEEEARELLSDRSALLTQNNVETPGGLRTKQKDCTEALAQTQTAHENVKEQLQNAEKSLQTARNQQQLLDAVEAAQERVETLRAKQGQQRTRKARAKAAEQAQRIESAEVRLQDRRNAREEASSALQEAQNTYESAQNALKEAQSEVENEQAKGEERDALTDKITKLESARSDVAALSEAKEARTSTQTTYDKAVEAEQTLSDEIKALQEQIAEATSVVETHEEAAQAVPERTSAVETWQNRLENARQLHQTKEALQEAQQELSDAHERVAAREEERDAKKAQVRALEQARDEGYASVLAARLQAGDACPVCGSTSHPAPADEEHDVPDAEALNTARTTLDEAESALQSAQEKATQAQRAVDKHTSKIEALQDTDAALTEHTVSEIEANYRDAEATLVSAKAAKEKVEAAQQRLGTYREELDEKQEALEAKKEAVREAESAHVRAADRVEDLTKRVPEGIESVDALDDRLETLQTELTAYTEALEQAKEQFESAKTAHTRAETTLENARTQSEDAHEAYSNAETAFQEALKAQGFEDRAAYMQARMEPDALEALRDEIQTVEQEWSNAQAELKAAEAKAEDVDAPDVEGANKQVETLKTRLSELDQKIGGLQSTHKSLKQALARLERIETKAANAEARVERIGHLSQVARGKGANERNISLQRYVLAARLKDVLEVANTHLQRMSQNQYHLKRATTLHDGRSKGGLELRVHDAYTNEERGVGTLSGGEGFNAALSLALGLSDVVQRRTGGRRLNTLFIDEGFGTLDQETLQRALNVLNDVQEQQKGRLLGVISHVSELKRRLPARLMVHAAQDGSSVEVHV